MMTPGLPVASTEKRKKQEKRKTESVEDIMSPTIGWKQ